MSVATLAAVTDSLHVWRQQLAAGQWRPLLLTSGAAFIMSQDGGSSMQLRAPAFILVGDAVSTYAASSIYHSTSSTGAMSLYAGTLTTGSADYTSMYATSTLALASWPASGAVPSGNVVLSGGAMVSTWGRASVMSSAGAYMGLEAPQAAATANSLYLAGTEMASLYSGSSIVGVSNGLLSLTAATSLALNLPVPAAGSTWGLPLPLCPQLCDPGQQPVHCAAH